MGQEQLPMPSKEGEGECETAPPIFLQVAERGVEAQQQQQYNPCTDLSRMHYSPR